MTVTLNKVLILISYKLSIQDIYNLVYSNKKLLKIIDNDTFWYTYHKSNDMIKILFLHDNYQSRRYLTKIWPLFKTFIINMSLTVLNINKISDITFDFFMTLIDINKAFNKFILNESNWYKYARWKGSQYSSFLDILINYIMDYFSNSEIRKIVPKIITLYPNINEMDLWKGLCEYRIEKKYDNEVKLKTIDPKTAFLDFIVPVIDDDIRHQLMNYIKKRKTKKTKIYYYYFTLFMGDDVNDEDNIIYSGTSFKQILPKLLERNKDIYIDTEFNAIYIDIFYKKLKKYLTNSDDYKLSKASCIV